MEKINEQILKIISPYKKMNDYKPEPSKYTVKKSQL